MLRGNTSAMWTEQASASPPGYGMPQNPGNGPTAGEAGEATDRRQRHRRANHFGIDSYGRDSPITGQRHSGRRTDRPNLGRSGMGCGYSGTNCTENGAGIRIKSTPAPRPHGAQQPIAQPLEQVGMNGIDVFGRATSSRTTSSIARAGPRGTAAASAPSAGQFQPTTEMHDLTIRGNVIRDITGNTDGTAPAFETLFSLGIYLDNYSRDMVVENNTVTGSTWTGALFQHSTGTFTGNTLYDNVASSWGSEMSIVLSGSRVTQRHNIMFPLGINRRSVRVGDSTYLNASNDNTSLQPLLQHLDRKRCDWLLRHDPRAMADLKRI